MCSSLPANSKSNEKITNKTIIEHHFSIAGIQVYSFQKQKTNQLANCLKETNNKNKTKPPRF